MNAKAFPYHNFDLDKDNYKISKPHIQNQSKASIISKAIESSLSKLAEIIEDKD